jgi:hypothetical protein
VYERETEVLRKDEEEGENLKLRGKKFKEVVEREMVMFQGKWSRRNENDSYKRELSRLKVKNRTNDRPTKRESIYVCVCICACKSVYIHTYFSKYCAYSRVTPGKSKTSKLLKFLRFVENESSLQHSQEHAVIYYLAP